MVRFLLAISVVLVHAGGLFGYIMAGGEIAVQSFYIVSGFYMTLILREKYIKEKSYWLFITNRLLRIYPIYWLMLSLTFLVCLFAYNFGGQNFLTGNPLSQVFQHSPIQIINDIQRNIFIVTWDKYYILNYKNSYSFLMSQSWTLGLEILFYFLAPFILRRSFTVILVFTILSFAVRVCVHMLNVTQGDIYTYYFFPVALSYFMLGAFSYFIYKYIRTKNISEKYLAVPFCLTTIFIVLYTLFPWDQKFIFVPLKYYYYVLLVASLGFIFQFTKNYKVDRILGELSYPVYVSHVFIVILVSLMGLKNNSASIVVLIATVAFSYMLYKFVVVPIDRYRQARVKKSSSFSS